MYYLKFRTAQQDVATDLPFPAYAGLYWIVSWEKIWGWKMQLKKITFFVKKNTFP